MDKLVDRDCALLDGHCDCVLAIENCKYLDNLKRSNSHVISRANDDEKDYGRQTRNRLLG